MRISEIENMTDQTNQTPLEDLRNAALKHYDKAGAGIHHFNSSVPRAIDVFFDLQKEHTWETEFNRYSVKISPENAVKVINYIIKEYVIKHEATLGEVIMQGDNCLIYAPQVLANIVDEFLDITVTAKET